MGANERQVGGRHYQTEYQHWDLAIVVQLQYLEGCATKYLSRWRQKNGLQDLEKALHYHEKLIETATCTWSPRVMKIAEITNEVERFVKANKLTPAEHEYIYLLCTYRSTSELHLAHNVLLQIIEEAKMADKPKLSEPNYPGTPENGGHHHE